MAREAAARGERERGRQWLAFETGCPKNITTPSLVSSGFAQFLPSREDHTGLARAFCPAAEGRSLGPPLLAAAPQQRDSTDFLQTLSQGQNQTQNLILGEGGCGIACLFVFVPQSKILHTALPPDQGGDRAGRVSRLRSPSQLHSLPCLSSG